MKDTDMDAEILSEYDRLRTCTKNPGHLGFIPVNEFLIHHLPSPHRTVEVFQSVKTLADLTVRIVVQRKMTTYYGTGVIRASSRKKCPCLNCQSNEQHSKKVWFVYVTTAAHLISDDQEASKIRADAFYDNQFERYKIRTLYGHSIIEKCNKTDVCKISFTTRDEALADELNHHLQNYRNCIWNYKFRTNEKFAVVVSHPHGTSKKISIGTLSKSDSCLRASSRDEKSRVFESQLVNIEVEVHFPDGECSKQMIWMLDKKVKDTKEFLLRGAGIKDDPERWSLVMHHDYDGSKVMDDDMITRDYVDDLTEVKYVEFQECKT